MALCAVILTHASAPLYEHLVSVPYIVTTDNPIAARHDMWGAKFIDVSPFQNTEMAIGRHMHLAMTQAFKVFPSCSVLSVLEDDVEVMSDYFFILEQVASLLDAPNTCFTCMNDRGFHHQGPWDPHILKHVTHSIGLGFAMSRKTFEAVTWGVRNWDHFLRATAHLTCLMPEVSRCRHHAHKGSTHGTRGEALRVSRLPYIRTPVTWVYVVPAPTDATHAYPLCTCTRTDCPESYRGTYNGVVSRALGNTCRSAPPLPGPSDLWYRWRYADNYKSCSTACREQGMQCSEAGLREPASIFIAEFSACDYYGAEMGKELPSAVMVDDGSRICNVPVLSEASSCSASHPMTRRLCPCYQPTRLYNHLFL